LLADRGTENSSGDKVIMYNEHAVEPSFYNDPNHLQALIDEQAAMECHATLHDDKLSAEIVALTANRRCMAEWVFVVSMRGSKWVVERRRRVDNKLVDIL